jgi:hypothetical protein
MTTVTVLEAGMSSDNYDQREISEARALLTEIRKAPLADRRDARASFLNALRDPEIVGERLTWLINGSYGYGEMLLAKRVLQNPRMNRAAALTQLVAAFEWRCPEDFARDAWKQLSKREQTALQRAIDRVIRDAEKSES